MSDEYPPKMLFEICLDKVYNDTKLIDQFWQYNSHFFLP